MYTEQGGTEKQKLQTANTGERNNMKLYED